MLALNWSYIYKDSLDIILGLHTRVINPSFANVIFLPLESTKELVDSFQHLRPDIIINAAALTNIEYCEQNPCEARYVNVDIAVNIATACQELQIPLVHLSTDHLFSGLSAYADETTHLNPLNTYAKTKAQAERLVQQYFPKALVIRTNFYGWGLSYRYSFADHIIKTLESGGCYRAFYDIFYTPILISDLASIILEMVELEAYGVYNISGDDRISKYEFAVLLAKIFKLPASSVYPISIDDHPMLVKRPKDMSLSNLKASEFTSRRLGGVDDGIYRLYNQQLTGVRRELNLV